MNDRKYFTEKQIYLATFLAGPIAAGFLIFKNLRRIGENAYARTALLSSIAFTIIFIYAIFRIPEEMLNKVPDFLYTAIITAFVFLIYHASIAKIIRQKFEAGAKKASNWQVAGFSLAGIAIFLLAIIPFAIFSPVFPGEKIVVDQRHNIYYDHDNIANEDIQACAQLLSNMGYFSDDLEPQSVRMENTGGQYRLIIPVDTSYWKDPGILNALGDLKESLIMATEHDYQVVLVFWKLTGDELRKKI